MNALHDRARADPRNRSRLERERAALHERLYARPSDCAATRELRAVNAALAATPDADVPDQGRLRRSGMSSLDRMRSWFRRRRRRT
jgi:hypothetical protein